MTMMETICARKSVRSFTGEIPTADQMNQILKAANAAPVGMAQYDGVHLTVITNKELLDRIDAAAAAMFGKPDAHPIYHAPMLIVVSTRKTAPMMENVAHSNAAIIVHNMALAAAELGVGACYIWGATAAMTMNPELIQTLNLPENFSISCALALGQTNEQYTQREIPMDRIACRYLK